MEDNSSKPVQNAQSSQAPSAQYESTFNGEDRGAKPMFQYFAACFLGNGLMCALTISLWSSMWLGDVTLTFLEDNDSYKYYFFAGSVVILLVMFVLDFFLPPFVPEGGHGLLAVHNIPGRAMLGIACALFMISCFLMAKSYPHVPMILTIFLCPGSTALVRHWIKPKQSVEDLPQEQAAQIIAKGDVEKKMRYLKGIIGEEQDVTAFYRGAMYSFFACSVGSLLAWLLWVHYSEESQEFFRLSGTQMEDKFMTWVCPLVLAISNFVFGLFVVLRVAMQTNYARTDIYRAQLLAEGMKSSMHDDMKTHKMTLNLARLTEKGKDAKSAADPEKLEERYTAQHASHIRQLSMIVKVVACTFVMFIGILYVASQLLSVNVYVASMVLGMLGAFFIVFVVFTYLSFRRIVQAMGQWIKDLPVWSTMKWVSQQDWLRAMFLCPGAPLIPLVLVLSVINQYARKCRGTYNNMPEHALKELGEDAGKSVFTPRVVKFMKKARTWNWLSLTWWCYMWCAAFVAYNVTPPILNVGLAWLRDALRLWPFLLVLVMTFFIGVGAFLCPVVPGMTVYVFGGLIVANTCPSMDRGMDAWVAWQEDTLVEGSSDEGPPGFWMGAVINIGLSWFLKLAACAVQQKLIGELLGSRMWVRQQVGVHKTHIRCIESILSKRGWTVGKVAILCGGPDWPTSVLAGVLRLSLFQCELGTLPIIGFVAPCAMTGSFYLMKGNEDPIWERSANLMIIVSVFVNLLLWAIAAWAIAQELEHNTEELTTPLPQNVELVWLDYKAEEVDKRCKVTWDDVPKCIRWIYIVGAAAHICVCHALFWTYTYLIGSFQVQDMICRLQPYSGTLYFSEPVCSEATCDCKIALFSMAACIVLAVYFVSWAFYFQFTKWKQAKLRAPRKAAEAEISLTGAAWKESWLKDANDKQAARKQVTPTVEVASEPDPSKEDTFEQVPDAADNDLERPPQVTEMTEPPPQLRDPVVEPPPPPMSLVASDLSKAKGEPVKLKSVSLTDRDVHEDLRELPMPVSDAVESRGLSRREIDTVPDGKLETCETASSSGEQSRKRSYIECICCQLSTTGNPLSSGEQVAKASL